MPEDNDYQETSNQSASESASSKQKREISLGLPEGWKKGKESEEKTRKIAAISEELIVNNSAFLIRVVGYGFLLFSLFDYLNIIIPPQLTNAEWEFQTMGRLVEQVGIPLLGFALIFYRAQGSVAKKELGILQFFSWLTLVMGICYLLTIPLFFHNTFRLDRLYTANVNYQIQQQTQQLQQNRQQLNKLSEAQLQQILTSIKQQNNDAKIATTEELKSQLLGQITTNEETLKQQAANAQKNRKIALFKNAIKWILQALMSGTILIWIWRLTRWTRISGKMKNP